MFKCEAFLYSGLVFIMTITWGYTVLSGMNGNMKGLFTLKMIVHPKIFLTIYLHSLNGFYTSYDFVFFC